MPRDTDRSHLHPAFRSALVGLEMRLTSAGLSLALFEGARSPFRQAELYAQGRGVGETGKTVTRAKSWGSFHQYGIAADYVFRKADGTWTWDEPRPGDWDLYTRLCADQGLRTLSFERPHVELPVSLTDLQSGRYPSGGDDSWSAWLEQQIELWGPSAREVHDIMQPGAPPLPPGALRPPLAS